MPWTPPNAEHPPPKPGEPPLFAAARTGDHAAIVRLVEGGADVEQVFDIGLDPGARQTPATPLMVAAGSGDGATIDTVRLLLKLGADPARIVGASSAASMAAEGLGWNYRPGGDAARLALLVERGGLLPRDPRRQSKLLCDTAQIGDADRLAILLHAGFAARGHWDPQEARAEYETMIERMRRTVESEDFLSKVPEGARELIRDPMESMADSFEWMTRGPSDFEIPLFCAARSGSGACVRLLLERGADALQRDNSKRTAMYSATSHASVRALLEAGVPIEDRDEFGCSPLVNAFGEERGVETVGALIEFGANANATHDGGYTAFMSAVQDNRHPQVLRMLIAAGADPHAITDGGYNAFHSAVGPECAAKQECSVRDTLGYLKRLGVEMELVNAEGQTPLAKAVAWGAGVEVRVLCELGANPNASGRLHRCGDGGCHSEDAPLLVCAILGFGLEPAEKVAALLRAGADPLARDAGGFTALEHAVAEVVADAAEGESVYRAFFRRLAEASTPGAAADRPEAIRACVRGWASAVPAPEPGIFHADRRAELLACIEHLAAHEARAPRPGSPPGP